MLSRSTESQSEEKFFDCRNTGQFHHSTVHFMSPLSEFPMNMVSELAETFWAVKQVTAIFLIGTSFPRTTASLGSFQNCSFYKGKSSQYFPNN